MHLSWNLFCFISLILFVSTWAESVACNPGKGPKLLYRINVYRQAFKGLSQDVYVAYPKDSDLSKPDLEIVNFCVTDHDPNLYGAKAVFAYSVEDDMDRKLGKATIILRGQESRGINSTVEFYGFSYEKKN